MNQSDKTRTVSVDGAPVTFRLHIEQDGSSADRGSIHGACDGPPHLEADLGPAGAGGLQELSDEQLVELWRAKWRIGA